MTRSRARRRALAAVLLAPVALAAIAPALGQNSPQSLLPPGFGDPPEEAPSEPTPAPRPVPPAATPTPPDASEPAPAATPAPGTTQEPAAEEDEDVAEAPPPPPLDVPEAARRDPRYAGLTDIAGGALGVEAWGRADGRYLSTLMRRLDAPVASRWAHILLRRALIGRAAAPSGVTGADWAAERAWLLLRMGEADMARALVQSVDVGLYTPKMQDVAMQAVLAMGDPAGACPMLPNADRPFAGWDIARAWCAALAGEQGSASAILDEARRRSGRGIDLLLAEKVTNAGQGGRRAVTIQWDGVGRISTWRYGLATATGVALPEALMDETPPRVWAWGALSPMRSSADRLPYAAVAARLGVLSNLAYADLYGAVGDATDPAELGSTPAGTLRTAYVGTNDAARLAALRELWRAGEDADARFAAHVLTARAAARIAPAEDHVDDADDILAALLSAGLDTRADHWAEVLAAADPGDAWAMLAVASPAPRMEASGSRLSDYVAALPARSAKGRLLVAGLAGLGRVDAETVAALAGETGTDLSVETRWVEAISRAAAAQQPGAVALLAAVGLQAEDWRGVPPVHLYHIVRALVAVGLEPEARMIAAEAVARG